MKTSNFVKTSNGVKISNGVNIAINGSRLRPSATLGTTAGKLAVNMFNIYN